MVKVLCCFVSLDCEVTLTVPPGGNATVMSPGHPNEYPNNTYCFWTIVGQSGRPLRADVVSFDTGECCEVNNVDCWIVFLVCVKNLKKSKILPTTVHNVFRRERCYNKISHSHFFLQIKSMYKW